MQSMLAEGQHIVVYGVGNAYADAPPVVMGKTPVLRGKPPPIQNTFAHNAFPGTVGAF